MKRKKMGIKKIIPEKNKLILVLLYTLCIGYVHGDYATDYLPENMEEKKEYSGVYLFQKSQGNYLVFYNGNGDLLYFRYRRDPFDYDNNRFLKMSVPGIPFFVTYIFEKYEEEELTVTEGINVKIDRSKEIRKRRKIIQASIVKMDYYIDDMIRY